MLWPASKELQQVFDVGWCVISKCERIVVERTSDTMLGIDELQFSSSIFSPDSGFIASADAV